MEFNGYDLSRTWFDWCFENPEKINPNHAALYFFCIEHCNRLGWKEKFGLPTSMAKEAIGIKNFRTYKKTLDDLVSFGFIKMIEISKNQYSSNIIAIVKNTKAHTKALDKALQKHSTKHCKSIDSIDKQETINKEPLTNKVDDAIKGFNFGKFTENEIAVLREWIIFRNEMKKPLKQQSIDLLKKDFEKSGIVYVKKQIENSIKNGWQGLFPLKDEEIKSTQQNNGYQRPKMVY